MKKFTNKAVWLACIIFFIYSLDASAQLYWRGTINNNWGTAANWSTSPVANIPSPTPPTAADDAVFNANSFPAAGKIVVVTAGATCRNLDWTAATNTPTFQISNPLTVAGTSATFIDNMTIAAAPAALTFTNTGNITLQMATASKTLGDLSFTATAVRTIDLNTNNGTSHTFGNISVGANSTFNVNGTCDKNITSLTLGNGVLLTFNGKINNTGNLSFGSNTTSVFNGSNNAIGGTTVFGTGTTATFNNNTTFTGAVTVSGTSATGVSLSNTTFNSAAANTLTGTFTMPGTFNVNGAGITTFNGTGNNTFTTVNVASNRRLDINNTGNNTFNGDFTGQASSTLNVGNGTGNNTFNTNFTTNAGSVFNFSNTGTNTFTGIVTLSTDNATLGGTNVFNNQIVTATAAGKTLNISNPTFNASSFNQFNGQVNITGLLQLNGAGTLEFKGTGNNNFQTINIANSRSILFSNTGTNSFTGVFSATAFSNVTLQNAGNNTFSNTVNAGVGSSWKFTTGGTTTFTAAAPFTTAGNCPNPVIINSSSGSPAATVSFGGGFPNTDNINISNINNTAAAVNITSGTTSGGLTNITIAVLGTTPRTLYWVGNGSSWSDASRWSLSSNGPVGNCPPTAVDDVIFDNNSFFAGGQSVIVTPGAICRNMTWNTTDGDLPTLNLANTLTMTGTAITFADKMSLSGTGKMSFTNTGNISINMSTVSKTTGDLDFTATTARTITLATNNVQPHTFGTITVGNNATFNVTGTADKTYSVLSFGTAVTATFAGISNISSGTSFGDNDNITFNGNLNNAGTLGFGNTTTSVFNGTTNTLSGAVVFGSGTRTTFAGTNTFNNNFLIVGTTGTSQFNNTTFGNTGTTSLTGTYTFTGTTNFNSTNPATLNGAYSVGGTMNVNGAGSVSFGGTGNDQFAIVNVAAGRTLTVNNAGTVNETGALTIGNGAAFNIGNAVTTTTFGNTIAAATGSFVTFSNTSQNNTFNGDVSLASGVKWLFNQGGNSVFNAQFLPDGTCANPIILGSHTGTNYANVNFNTFPNANRYNLNVTNLNYVGVSPPLVILDASGSSNSNITLNGASGNPRTLYWVNGTGNWSSGSNWSIVSGGTKYVCPPTTNDDVIFDNNSFSAVGQSVSTDASSDVCRTMTWTNQGAKNPTFNLTANNVLGIYGSMTLDASMQTISNQSGARIDFRSTVAATRTLLSAGRALPSVQFDGAGGTWSLSDALNVVSTLYVNQGTFKMNGQGVTCLNFNANLGGDLARTVDMGNSTLTITGSAATGTSNTFDIRGNNITWVVPGATALIQWTNPSQWVQGFFGITSKELPDLLYTGGCNDIDMFCENTTNRMTFRNITITTTTGSQFYIVNNAPKTFKGNINFPTNLNNNPDDQRQIVGPSSAALAGRNIFQGTVTIGANSNFNFNGDCNFLQPVTAGNNCRYFFNGNMDFQSTLTMGTGSQLYFTGGNTTTDTFNGNVTVAGTQDNNDVVQFSPNAIFNAALNITATNTNRLTPTVRFNNIPTTTSTFNGAVSLSGPTAIYRFSGNAVQAAGQTLTVNNDVDVQFVGGDATNASGFPLGSTGFYTFNGTLSLIDQSKASFYNTSNNTLTGITMLPYSTIEFTPEPTAVTAINGTFSVNNSCGVWTQVKSSRNGDQALINMGSNQNIGGSITQDINEAAGGGVLTVSNGSDAGNNTNVSFIAVNTGYTFYWVGGYKNTSNGMINISGNSNWNDPKNWTTDPTLEINRINGGACIPQLTNDVVFADYSFSPADYTVIIDKGAGLCKSMTWQDDITTNTGGNLPTLTGAGGFTDQLLIGGNCTFAGSNRMVNAYTGVIQFSVTGSTAVTQTVDCNGADGSCNNNINAMKGPVIFIQQNGKWQLNSDLTINAGRNGSLAFDGGDFLLRLGSITVNSCTITLDGDWIVESYCDFPTFTTGDQATFNSGTGTVVFNGQNSINNLQRIVAGNTYSGTLNQFYNLEIRRQSNGLSNEANIFSNQKSNVVIGNKNNNNVMTSDVPGITAAGSCNPGQRADQPYNNGLTVLNNLLLTSGTLWDNGYQIVGSAGGKLTVTANATLHLGTDRQSSGNNNNAPMTSLFPTNFGTIDLQTGSTVVYRAYGHQDISATPAYSNLYFYNPNKVETGLSAYTGTATRKRLAMGALRINSKLTIEQGILFADNGFQVNAGAVSSLTIQNGGTFAIGSSAMSLATSYGTGSNPATNTTGTLALANTATQFPANFVNASLNLDANSIIAYHAATPQTIRGLNSATAAQQYGHLLLTNQTTIAPTVIQKTLSAAATVRGNLVIHPNNNLIDNGFQMTGTAGQTFAMNYGLNGPFNLSFFNNLAPVATGSNDGSSLLAPAGTFGVNTNFGMVYSGYIVIPTTGTYTFYTASDDGSVLYINGTLVVNNNYYQGTTERSGNITLTAGVYPLVASYYQGNGGYTFTMSYQGPSIAKQIIPPAALRTKSGTAGLIDYSLYSDPYFGSATGVGTPSPYRAIADLTQQSMSSQLSITGQAQMVLGNASTSTTFPLNYLDSDLTFQSGTKVVYNGAFSQSVRGLNDAGGVSGERQYAALVLTNPESVSPVQVAKTLTSATTIRDSLVINPNNGFTDAGFQITGTSGTPFRMKNAGAALNPVTNSGLIGLTGASRLILGTPTVATTFPAGYNQTGTDMYFETGTAVVYNSGVAQQVAGLAGTAANSVGRYADLLLTNPATVVSGTSVFPVVKTLQSRAITIRGNLTINPNNTFADGGRQITGTSGSLFSMFNTTLPTDPATGTTIGIIGESRLVIGSNGNLRTFPGGYRTGDGSGANPSDINFEGGTPGTTVVYNTNETNAPAATPQLVQGLGGNGNTTYANLVLNNPSGASQAIKTLQSNGIVASPGTLIRGDLTIGSANNFLDNGFQVTGTAGRKFNMFNTTLNFNPIRANTGQSATSGGTGISTFTIGTPALVTTFPGGYTTLNGTDINFETNTLVVYNAGLDQPIQGVFNSTINSNANYYNVTLTNTTGTLRTKSLTANNARIRGDLNIGVDNNLSASASNFNIYIQGNWIANSNSRFTSGAGAFNNTLTLTKSTVVFEGGNNQNVTTSTSQPYNIETDRDFQHVVINKAATTNTVSLLSNVGIQGTAKFNSGIVVTSNQPSYTTSPANVLIFRSGSTAVNSVGSAAADQMNGNVSYVQGAIRKVGNANFTFPYGNTNARPASISGITDITTSFLSQYYFQSTKAAGFPANLRQDPPLSRVSAVEFWIINRENGSTPNSDAFVTLTWDANSGGVGIGAGSTVSDYTKLLVSRWNGPAGSGQWRNMGGTTLLGNNTAGSVTSTLNVAGAAGKVDQFSPFTLASLIPTNPLPVTLVKFDVQLVDKQVNLTWQTSFEKNTKNFVIERSTDGQNFAAIGSVNAAGNVTSLTNYSSLDRNPTSGVNYYRLKIVDYDGSFDYSKTLSIRLDGLSTSELSLYPNPSNGKVLNFKYNAPFKLNKVFDVIGHTFAFKETSVDEKTLSVEFDQKLAAGTYIALLTSADGKVQKIRFVVE